jgi:hypothetical protein
VRDRGCQRPTDPDSRTPTPHTAMGCGWSRRAAPAGGSRTPPTARSCGPP